jgi:NarL family two-component system sensor histidine kinase YdfH
MGTQSVWHKLFNLLFVPPGDEDKKAFKEILPFYLLVTLVMGWIYTVVMTSNPTVQDPGVAAAFTILLVVHLVLYWLTIFFSTDKKRTYLYLVFQGVLIFVIVLITRSDTLVMALYTSMIGNSVGMLGKSKATLVTAGYYLLLALVSLSVVAVSPQLSGLVSVLLPVTGFTIFFAYFFNRQIEARKQTQDLLDELEAAHQQLAEYTVQVEDLTLAGERQRMARELHDTLAQGLAGLILQLEAVAIHIEEENTSKAGQIVEQAMVKARATLVDARKAIDDLRAEIETPQALEESLNREMARFREATGISCRIEVGLPSELNTKLGEHILRTVTEGLWNIARHAQAAEAGVTVSTGKQAILITIEDDGVGFDPGEKVGRGGHYGLLGIRERARLAGGDFSVESQSGGGTRLRVSLPYGDAEEQA